MPSRKSRRLPASVTVTVHAPNGTRTLTVDPYWVGYWRGLGYRVEVVS